MSRNIYFSAFIVLLAFSSCKELYDNTNSNVINLNKKNFDTQITSNRSKKVISIVHYYTINDGKSSGYKPEFEKLASEYDGMFRVCALNCNDFKEICEKNDIREYPTFKVYPPLPAPVMTYENKIEAGALVSYMGRFLDNNSVELNNNNIDIFLKDNPNLPKCILFTDKKGVPLLFKALSVAFQKKIEFGIVRSDDSGITSKYKVNSFPKIMVIGVTDKKPNFYTGDNKYKPLFDYLNVYSETFFRVGEDNTTGSGTKEEKPWLSEKLPELHQKSANEICFKVDGIMCVILLNNGKPADNLINLFSSLQNYLSPKIDRGIKYKFGWIDSITQASFMEVLGVSSGAGPNLMLLNPGKRKRFYIMENDMNEENMREVFDKLASGDIKFKNFPGNTIPELA